MDLGLILLRIAHVVAGAAWVGGAFLMILIVTRSARLVGKSGDDFLEALFTVGRGAKYFELAALTTVIAGSLLYWRASNGFDPAWVTSPTGLAFTVGALAAIVSLAWGGAMVGPTTKRMSGIGAEIAAAGGVATAAQATTIDTLRRRLDLFAKADLVLLGVAVLTMSTARYL